MPLLEMCSETDIYSDELPRDGRAFAYVSGPINFSSNKWKHYRELAADEKAVHLSQLALIIILASSSGRSFSRPRHRVETGRPEMGTARRPA